MASRPCSPKGLCPRGRDGAILRGRPGEGAAPGGAKYAGPQGERVQPITFDVVQWLVNQGVAIAVLAFVLVRLEARLTAIEVALRDLADILTPKRAA